MILVFIEHTDGVLNGSSIEAIAAAQSLARETGLEVSAVIAAGADCPVADEIAGYDLADVIVAKSEKLSAYTPDGFTDGLEAVIKSRQAKYFVMSHTYQARDFSPKLAARFGTELLGDCIRYRNDDGRLVFTRRIFLGKLDADVALGGDGPYFVSFQSGAFRTDEALKGSAEVVEMVVETGEIRMVPGERFQEAKASVDLTKSDVIVAVGRGIKSEENLAFAQELADVLGADIAASRPICDAEWLPIDRQIGSSGQTVTPKLYIALGISGAIQHIVGMKNSGTIVAINKDAEAPIFDIADYGIAGDLFEAVPAMVEALKEG